MEKKKLLVIGSLNMDMVVNVAHTPCAGETILSKTMQLIPGGKGANQAFTAGRMGADVTMLGIVGQDSYAEHLRKSLCSAGVDTSRLIQRQDSSTGLAMIAVNQEGDNSIIVVSGANATLMPEDIEQNRDLLESCEIVMFQLEIPLETVCYGAKLAKQLGKTVFLDPAPVPEKFPEELYRYIDYMKPNETELAMLTGIADVKNHLQEATGILREKGVKHIIATLGEAGVFVNSESHGIFHVPARRVAAVDTTAAGDAFSAALAARLLTDAELREAVQFANCVSAITVTREGAQSSVPTLVEAERIYAL